MNFKTLVMNSSTSQTDLAKKLNISKSAVSQWNLNCTPKIELIPQIAEALNCTIEEVVLALIETRNQIKEV